MLGIEGTGKGAYVSELKMSQAMRGFIVFVVFCVVGFSSSFLRAELQVSEASDIQPMEVQKALKEAGFYKGAVDGIVGPKTRSAIRAFQQEHGLTVDGVCGPKTWERLKAYLSEPEEEVTEEAAEETLPSFSEETLDEDTFDEETLGADLDLEDDEAEPQSENLKQKLIS